MSGIEIIVRPADPEGRPPCPPGLAWYRLVATARDGRPLGLAPRPWLPGAHLEMLAPQDLTPPSSRDPAALDRLCAWVARRLLARPDSRARILSTWVAPSGQVRAGVRVGLAPHPDSPPVPWSSDQTLAAQAARATTELDAMRLAASLPESLAVPPRPARV